MTECDICLNLSALAINLPVVGSQKEFTVAEIERICAQLGKSPSGRMADVAESLNAKNGKFAAAQQKA
jgi:hypothetical protein